jgi:hypothetical protein
VTLKSLVTGVAAAAVVAGAAAGVTSIASPAIATAACVNPGTLEGVLNALADPNINFYPNKEGLVEGGIGRIKGRFADGELKNAYATGALPVKFVVDAPVCNGNNMATSNVSAGSQSMPLTFVNNGSNWMLSSPSATAILAAFGG